MKPTLREIRIHPVKGCRAITVDEVEVVGTGLAGDRLYQVIDADSNAVTQRQEPRLATVQVAPVDGGLLLEAEGRTSLEVAPPVANDVTANSLVGTPVEAADAGDEAAAWFTALLDSPGRLVALTERSEHRFTFLGLDLPIGWADAAPVLVANTASLDWLAERASEPFGMDRFRPNLVVDGGEPWIEDTWRDFSIGGARFGLGLAWPRCAVPQVDQIDASRHKEPASVLKQHRWCAEAPLADEALRPLFEGNALFGIACSVGPTGATIAVGDAVTVHKTGDRMIPAPG